ncbi:MAG TPA: hypothetical protein VGR96_02840 [Acidobacteriaceae bacterium]|nr:hypothetical protein [Acidobacteriaceae bacterium]
MSDIVTLNAQIIDSVKQVHASVAAPEIVRETGSGKAFNFVAQATAIAVQDASDNLRNISTMSTTAIGVAMAQLISSGDIQTWGPVVQVAQGLVRNCAEDFQRIGNQAAEVLRNFPPAQASPLPVND